MKKILLHFKTRLQTPSGRLTYLFALLIATFFFASLLNYGIIFTQKAVSSLISPMTSYTAQGNKSLHEVLGFAPYWTFHKLDNVDFNVLTTLAYFGIEVQSDGNLDQSEPGYETFHSDEATKIFKQAHKAGTKVVLTVTNMVNGSILQLLDSQEAQDRAIAQTIAEVKKKRIDGVNIDFEYSGDPGQEYRDKFSSFVANFISSVHEQVGDSQVTVSVYAASQKDPKIYDIASLGASADGVFMMAYDFATTVSENAIPTAPLYGKNSARQYWYDIASAVDDFLKVMPAHKLILGVPYYGYNYLVYEPLVKAETRPYWSWRGQPRAQTYSIVKDEIHPNMEGIDQFIEGRDPDSKVPYKAYHVVATDTWRMVFYDDKESLELKYDFAKGKELKGVGMWALGFDDGKKELWDVLASKFGSKVARK